MDGGSFHPRRANETFVEQFHAKNQIGHSLCDRAPHLFEQLAAFPFVLDLGINLSVAHQADGTAQVIHGQQMVFPRAVDQLQDELPFHPANFRSIAIFDGVEQPRFELFPIQALPDLPSARSTCSVW